MGAKTDFEPGEMKRSKICGNENSEKLTVTGLPNDETEYVNMMSVGGGVFIAVPEESALDLENVDHEKLLAFLKQENQE